MKIEMKLGMDQATQLIQQIKVETVPPEIYQLEELMGAEQPNASDIAHLISKHPELLGDFLSLTNKVLNRPQDDLILEPLAAVNLLGLQEIQHLFLSTYLKKQLPTSDQDRKIILHSMRSGLAAAELSYWVNEIDRTEAYLIAFMQDIGAIFIMRHDFDHYAETYLNAQLNEPFSGYQAEFEHYQTAHTFVGSVIARRWHLSDLLSKSLLLYHQNELESVQAYAPNVAKMVALIQIANYLVFKTFSDHYMTEELQQSFEHARTFLALPDNAIDAAEAALKKWGNDDHMHFSSH